MDLNRDKRNLLRLSLGISIIVHVLILILSGWFGLHQYSPPVILPALVDVNFKPDTLPKPSIKSNTTKTVQQIAKAPNSAAYGKSVVPSKQEISHLPATKPAMNHVDMEKTIPVLNSEQHTNTPDAHSDDDEILRKRVLRRTRPASPVVIDPAIRKSSEFLTTSNEKLTYRISMLGIPVGNAELEAFLENNEVRITLRAKSSSIIDTLYPVDNLVETRHVGGNFILSKIRQREGSMRSERAFTIFLR